MNLLISNNSEAKYKAKSREYLTYDFLDIVQVAYIYMHMYPHLWQTILNCMNWHTVTCNLCDSSEWQLSDLSIPL